MSSYKDLRIVDNFYQTSAFFPMPTILVGTLTDDGKTTFGPYSLCQPYYIAGKEYYAMLLCCRSLSTQRVRESLVRPSENRRKKRIKDLNICGWFIAGLPVLE